MGKEEKQIGKRAEYQPGNSGAGGDAEWNTEGSAHAPKGGGHTSEGGTHKSGGMQSTVMGNHKEAGIQDTDGLTGRIRRGALLVAVNLLLLLVACQQYQADIYERAVSLSDMDIISDAETIVSAAEENGQVTMYEIGSDTYRGQVLVGPYYHLKEGTYTVTVSGWAQQKGSVVQVTSVNWLNEDNSTGQVFAEIPLSVGEEAGLSTETFTLARDVNSLELKLIYGGGVVSLTGMTIRSDCSYTDAFLVLGLIWGIELVLLLLLRGERGRGVTDAGKGNRGRGHVVLTVCMERVCSPAAIWLFMAGLALVATLPLYNDFGNFTHDMHFHLDRIEGMADWLSHLSAAQPLQRINEVDYAGAGYPSPVYYPELFLLVPALCRVLGGSLLTSYKIFVYLVNLMTAGISYYAFTKLSGRKLVGAAGSALYTFALYRLADIYTRGAIGEFLAMAFMPLLFWSLYEVIFRDRRRWGMLALAMTGILQSHILSTVLCAYLGLLFVIAGLGRLFRERGRVLALGKAAGLTVLINLWFLLPLLQYSTLPIQASFGQDGAVLRGNAVYLSQLFALFTQSKGNNLWMGTTQEEMTLSVGAVLAAGAAAALWYRLRDGRRREQPPAQGLFLAGAALSIWASTIYFSWDWAAQLPYLGRIQYVWRFLAPASAFLCYPAAVAMVRFLEEWRGSGREMRAAGRWQSGQFVLGVVLAVSVAGAIPYLDSIGQHPAHSKEETESSLQADELYLLREVSYHDLNAIVTSGDFTMEAEQVRREGTTVSAVLTVSGADEESWIELPVYWYPGYRLRDVEGNEIPIRLSQESGAVRFTPENGTTAITLRFEEPALWRAADVVSLLTLAGVGIWLVYRKRQAKSVQKE
ncbi:MAG: 6-pyruvoyl-tetrahydropterin synthase-related protein [Eubacteriales bacterium]|nr:6-pyruvoyl-tetrahydropterin synthase-related protein [Eubacteriales bacterium]